MSGQQLQPLDPNANVMLDEMAEFAPSPGGSGGAPSSPGMGRYWQAVKRFKWLVLALTILGAAAGVAATRFVTPSYEVRATLQLTEGGADRQGPIQAEALLEASGWQDLLRSYTIADYVVNELGLFVSPALAQDSALFVGFRVNQTQLKAGSYQVVVVSGRYALRTREGIEIESGAVGDSVGRTVGFAWRPDSAMFAGRSAVDFTVQTPREASTSLINRLEMQLTQGSPFLSLKLTGTDPQRTAQTLNEWVEQFVAVATLLKKRRVATMAAVLEGQRELAAGNLASAEAALESFRVRTVTEPNERPLPSGLEMTNSPSFTNFFRDKTQADELRRDREQLDRLLQRGAAALSREALLSVAIVNSDPAAQRIRDLLAEQAQREANLRKLRESFTDEFQKNKDEIAALAELTGVSLPGAVTAFTDQLRQRESTLQSTIARSSQDLRGIPQRAIEEQRLKRLVEVNDELYRSLNLKAAEAKLAEASTIPDVSITDPAVAPLRPTRNTAPVLIAGGTVGALLLGIALAILLDLTDRRFRYPEQATDELGLFVLGVIPHLPKGGTKASDTASAQVVEAFRTVRMNARYSVDPNRPFTLTVTSPGPGDGKSLVSSNLALSFAESGARTLLIDGDIRRGHLASTFTCPDRPGLVEYLDGTALISEVLHSEVSHPNLSFIPAGARRKRAPELLATPRLTQLIEQMSREYDVVIVDSPPLGAGFDAFALATATGNMALVMRGGITDRKMAASKLAVVQTLPIRVIGSVLNGIELTGVYEYYSYYQEYAALDEPDTPALPSGKRNEVAVVSGDKS